MLQRGASAMPTTEEIKFLIPIMTGNKAPSGSVTVSRSGTYAYYAFNKNYEQQWGLTGSQTPSTDDYVQYTFAKPVKKITGFVVLAKQAGNTTCGVYAVMSNGTEVLLGSYIAHSDAEFFIGTCECEGEIVSVKIRPMSFILNNVFYVNYLNVLGVE